MCVYIYIYTHNAFTPASFDTMSNFQAGFNRLEFRVFLLFNRLPYQSSPLIFIE